MNSSDLGIRKLIAQNNKYMHDPLDWDKVVLSVMQKSSALITAFCRLRIFKIKAY